jgi:hypothetical protein
MPAADHAEATEGGPEDGDDTSDLLLRAVRGQTERISVDEIINGLGARAFGLAVLVFALPSCVPMPPGVPTIVGFALLIVSIQMVMGRKDLWLPRFLSKRTFPRIPLVTALENVQPHLRTVERFARPRLLVLTGRLGTMLIGLVVLVLAVALILPLPPGGNFPPAVACAVLGMGLAERDGAIVLLGMVTSIGAMIAAWAVTLLFIRHLPALADWFMHLFGR